MDQLDMTQLRAHTLEKLQTVMQQVETQMTNHDKTVHEQKAAIQDNHAKMEQFHELVQEKDAKIKVLKQKKDEESSFFGDERQAFLKTIEKLKTQQEIMANLAGTEETEQIKRQIAVVSDTNKQLQQQLDSHVTEIDLLKEQLAKSAQTQEAIEQENAQLKKQLQDAVAFLQFDTKAFPNENKSDRLEEKLVLQRRYMVQKALASGCK